MDPIINDGVSGKSDLIALIWAAVRRTLDEPLGRGGATAALLILGVAAGWLVLSTGMKRFES